MPTLRLSSPSVTVLVDGPPHPALPIHQAPVTTFVAAKLVLVPDFVQGIGPYDWLG